MKISWQHTSIILLIAMQLFACKEKPAMGPIDYSSLPIFIDFRVTGEEEGGKVTVFLQFRAGAMDGPGISLDSGSTALFNGQPLQKDSTRMHGVFYEQNWLLKDFEGEHLLEYIRKPGDTVKTSIQYPIFQLVNKFPAKWKGEAMDLEFSGLPDGSTLQVLLMDTSFTSRVVDRNIQLVDNKLRLTEQDFSALKKGKILAEVFYAETSDLPDDAGMEGQLFMTYGLRRIFDLE